MSRWEITFRPGYNNDGKPTIEVGGSLLVQGSVLTFFDADEEVIFALNEPVWASVRRVVPPVVSNAKG